MIMPQWGSIRTIKGKSFIPLYDGEMFGGLEDSSQIIDVVCLDASRDVLELDSLMEIQKAWVGQPRSAWDALPDYRTPPSTTKQQAAMKFVEAVHKYGFHIDTSPTRIMLADPSDAAKAQSDEYLWWSNYVKSAEVRLREAARKILEMV